MADHSEIDDNSKALGKVFIGGLSWDSSNEGIREYFSRYGEVVDAVIMRDKPSGRSRGFGFVTFSDPKSIDELVKHDHVIDGRTVEIKRAIPKDEMSSGRDNHHKSTKKIFVGGLAHSSTDADFRKYFEQFGAITEAQVMMERDSGRHRGFGFVTFESESSVDRLMESDHHEINGKQVEIKRAEPKRPTQLSFRQGREMGMGGPFGGFGMGGPYGGGGYSSRGGGYGSGVPYGGGYGGPPYGGPGGYGGYPEREGGGRYGGSAYGGLGGSGLGGYWDGPPMYGGSMGGMGGYGAGAGAGYYGGYGGYGGGGSAGGARATGRAERSYHPYKSTF